MLIIRSSSSSIDAQRGFWCFIILYESFFLHATLFHSLFSCSHAYCNELRVDFNSFPLPRLPLLSRHREMKKKWKQRARTKKSSRFRLSSFVSQLQNAKKWNERAHEADFWFMNQQTQHNNAICLHSKISKCETEWRAEGVEGEKMFILWLSSSCRGFLGW